MAEYHLIPRRVCLKAAPLILVPAAVVAGAPDDETFALIATCETTAAAYDAAIDGGGTEPGGTTSDAYYYACDAAQRALCEYAPPTLAGAEAKARYIEEKFRSGYFECDENVYALIRSCAKTVRA